MARNPSIHIANALASLAKAQDAMSAQINTHAKIISSHGKDIARLEKNVSELRTVAIKNDLSAGLSGREVAAKYSLSEGRISQIKNS